ncbi:MAG: CHAT domain-containing protein [Saprospiraceae bacterium]|nr:CHAT domain-containing protein [Saprospiraceae bacterium]
MKRLFILMMGLWIIGHPAVSQSEDVLLSAATYSEEARFETSNNLLDEFIENNPSRLYDLANAYFLKSYNFMQVGNYGEALRSNQYSIELKTKLYAEDIAVNYMREGTIYLLQGDYERALNVLVAATEFPFEDPQLYALNYAYIASAEQALGDYDKALQRLNESLDILEFELGEDNPDFATGNYDLGRLYSKIDEPDKAEAAFKKALSVAEKLENNTLLKAKIYNAMGLLYQKTDNQKALDFYQKSLLESNKISSKLNQEAAITLLNVARVRIERFIELKTNLIEPSEIINSGTPSPAQAAIEQAISKITTADGTIVNHQIYAESLALKALDVLIVQGEETGLLTAALSDCFEAVRHLHLQLDLLSSDAAKFSLLEESHFIFETGLQVAMSLFQKTGKTSFAWDAFVLSEQAKAIVLHSNKTIMTSPDNEMVRLKSDIRQAEAQLMLDPDNISLHKKLTQQRKKIEDHFSLIEKPVRESAVSSPKQPEVQAKIPEKNALLTYFVGQSSYFIFAITNNDFKAVELPLDFTAEQQGKKIRVISNLSQPHKSTPGVYSQLHDLTAVYTLEQAVSGLLASIKKMDKEHYPLYGYDLFSKLIAPVAETLKGKNKLMVSPHQELFKIPFEALLSQKEDTEGKIKFNKLKYLIGDYAISYSYTGLSFWESQSLVEDERNASFLGLAPVFNSAGTGNLIQSATAYIFDTTLQTDENIRSVLENNKTFAPLQYSENEITGIGAVFQSKSIKSQTLLRAEASEEHFKAQCGHAGYIHLATHSFVHTGNPGLSGIAFFQPNATMITNSDEDGILYAAEIAGLPLQARLVVLSSCESSVGPIRSGDGPYSLARGFLEAGAEKVISSLWKIYDIHSQEMMIEFYKMLLNGQTEEDALRTAKLKMIKNSKTANPGIWSAFILME